MNDHKNTIVEIKDVEKFFETNHVIHRLNMKIYEGEFLTVLGSSGCGKTTILRMVGGFDNPSEGDIFLEGASVKGKTPFQRNVNTVFQSYALFPHMTVYDNIAYGLTAKKMSKKQIKEKVEGMLDLVQLSGFEKRQITQLSGGQKQRIAIARALVNEPKVLLLDEPLGALDLQLRKQMQVELKRLQKKLGITFIYVTHDQEEALTMSDRIAIMNGGYLEQIGTPEEIYEQPASKFVADFIGETNTFEAQVKSISDDGTAVVVTETGTGWINGKGLKKNQMVYLSIRPELMKYSYEKVEGFTLKGITSENIYVGSIHKCIVKLTSGQELKINSLKKESIPKEGEFIYPYWEIKDAVIIDVKDNKIFDAIDQIDFNTERKVNVHG